MDIKKLVDTYNKAWQLPERRKLTQKVVREAVRLVGGTFRKTEYGDFVLRFKNAGQTSISEYHTDSLVDVIHTARAMQEGNPNWEDVERFLEPYSLSYADYK